MYNKGEALDNLGRYHEAITYLNKAIEMNADYLSRVNYLKKRSYEHLFRKGITHASTKDYEEAIECFDEALKIEPEYKDAIKERASY